MTQDPNTETLLRLIELAEKFRSGRWMIVSDWNRYAVMEENHPHERFVCTFNQKPVSMQGRKLDPVEYCGADRTTAEFIAAAKNAIPALQSLLNKPEAEAVCKHPEDKLTGVHFGREGWAHWCQVCGAHRYGTACEWKYPERPALLPSYKLRGLVPDEIKGFEEYPFAWHFGNIKVALESMECTGKIPHGCPNCRGLDFCTKRDALKLYAKMEKCWDFFMKKASLSQEPSSGEAPQGYALVPLDQKLIPYEAWDNAATAFRLADGPHGFYESCYAAYHAFLRSIGQEKPVASPVTGGDE